MQDSLKRKLLAGGIAGALVLGVGAVAGAATGSFDNGTPEVGQHHGTEVGDDNGVDAPGTEVEHGTEVGDDNGVDAPDTEVGDDNGVDAPGSEVGDDNSVDAPDTEVEHHGGSGHH